MPDEINKQTRQRIQASPHYSGDINGFINYLLDNADTSIQTAHDVPNQSISSFMDIISDAFFVVDENWLFIYVNKKAEELLQKPKAQMLGRSVWEAFPEAVGSTFYQEYHRIRDTGQPSRFVSFYPPLDTWFEVQAYRAGNGVVAQFRDVTARKQQEEALQRSVGDLELRVRERTAALSEVNEKLMAEIARREEAQRVQNRLANILEATSDIVAVTDRQGNIAYMNRAAREILRLPPGADPTDYHARDFLDDAEYKWITDHVIPLVAQVGVWQGESRIVTLDGQQIPASQVVMRHEEGETDVFYSAITRDMSTQKQAEEELRQTLQKERELAELKTRFTSLVSHEFRTPLATIQTSTDLLLHYNDRMAQDKKDAYLTKIQKQIRQLKYLLDDFSSMNRADLLGLSFNPSALDVSALCSDVLDEMRDMDSGAHVINAHIAPAPAPISI